MALNDGLDIDEDVENPKVKSFPKAPSQQEVEDKNVNHLPFRSQCKHCVRGKSKASPHYRMDESIDYMFMHKRQSDGVEKGMPNLVMKHRESKTAKAFTVPAKGVNDYAVRRLVNY